MPWLLLLFACQTPEGCLPNAEPTLEIGVGENGFLPHIYNDERSLVFGPQGGHHLTLAVATTGFQLSEGITAEISGTVGDEEVAWSEFLLSLRCDSQSETQRAWDLPLPMSGDGFALAGETLTVDFSLTDDSGRTATDQAIFSLAP